MTGDFSFFNHALTKLPHSSKIPQANPMRIRPYQPSDLPTLSRIDQSCFPPGIAYSREELAGYVRHRSSVTWVAEANGAIVGFIVVSRQPARIGHIITIDVLEEWRGRGVGSALMSAADQWARQAKL